ASSTAWGTKFSEAIISSVRCWRRSSRSSTVAISASTSLRGAVWKFSGRSAIACDDDSNGSGYSAAVKAALSVVASALALAHGGWHPPKQNPCQGPRAGQLLCPNLRIGAPSEMYVSGYGGKVLLHATSDVRRRGGGPIELQGQRDGLKSMKLTQRIYKIGSGHITVRTGAALHFTDVGAYF